MMQRILLFMSVSFLFTSAVFATIFGTVEESCTIRSTGPLLARR